MTRWMELQQEYKYQKHSEKQFLFVLSVAEQLFVEHGIEKVKLMDIANECGIMRSTLYRYFNNKEEILWHIMRRNTMTFLQKLKEHFETTERTTYDRFRCFMDILYDGFICGTNSYLFIELFSEVYQNATSYNNNPLYNKVFEDEECQTGDMVRFLTQNFHDGSVREGLSPKKTAVAISYSAIMLTAGLYKQKKTLPLKYGVNADEALKISLNALLESIR